MSGEVDTTSKYIFEYSRLFPYLLNHKIWEVSEFGDFLTLIDRLTDTICLLSLREDRIVISCKEEYISIFEDDIVIDESDQRAIVRGDKNLLCKGGAR